MDPIADQFPHVSVFNYAENEPIRHIDLWGLQKAFFQFKLSQNSTFMTAYHVNRQTPEGKKFEVALKGQDKVNVLYASYAGVFDGKTYKTVFNSFEQFQRMRDSNIDNLAALDISDEEIKGYFEDGKKLAIMSFNLDSDCPDNCSSSVITDNASAVNHEEGAHVMGVFKDGKVRGNLEGHEYYYGEADYVSPNDSEVRKDSKYKGTVAKKNLDAIDEIVEREYK